MLIDSTAVTSALYLPATVNGLNNLVPTLWIQVRRGEERKGCQGGAEGKLNQKLLTHFA
jgi:hypothetical protein